MPGRDGTGPLTGDRRGFCGNATVFPDRGGGRGRRNQFYTTELPGWQRAQADAQATTPARDAPDALARVKEKLTQVLERLDHLESATRD